MYPVRKGNRAKYVTISGMLFSFLQRLGATNSFLQKLILHILQPIILFFLLFLRILYDTVPYVFYSSLFLIFLFIGYSFWNIWHELETERITDPAISSNEFPSQLEALPNLNISDFPKQMCHQDSMTEVKEDEKQSAICAGSEAVDCMWEGDEEEENEI